MPPGLRNATSSASATTAYAMSCTSRSCIPACWPFENIASMNDTSRLWNISGARAAPSARFRIWISALKQSLVTSLTRSMATSTRALLGDAHQRDLGLRRVERRRQVDGDGLLGDDLLPVAIFGAHHEVDELGPHRDFGRRAVR